MHILNLPVTCHSSTAICFQRKTRHLDAQSKLRIGLYMTTYGKYIILRAGLGSWKPAHMSPRFAEKLTWVGWIISVFTWLFLSHQISRLGGTKLCKHGISEISFVVIKQTAPCITILVVFSNCAVEYHIISQNRPKMSISVGWDKAFISKILPHLTKIHLAQDEISPHRTGSFFIHEHILHFICVNKGHADLTQVSFQVN
jgi:hypothetical protein